MPVDLESIRQLATPHAGAIGGVITALRAIQRARRCIPEAVDVVVADVFNISRAEVRGIVSFYTDFSRTPKRGAVVRLCAAEACQAMGGRSLQREVEGRLGLRVGEASAAGDVTLEHVYCLGLCSAAPAAMVDGRLVGKADPERIEKAVSRAKRAARS